MKYLLFICGISILAFSGCYQDKLDEMYPGAGLFTVCDTTTTPSYSTHIVPIIQNYCIGCHNGTNGSGGCDLSNYNGVFVWANGGVTSSMVGNTWHQSGYFPMPPSYTLDSCQLKLIYNWVNNGAPNN
ncbi:hypothetical protein BH09BAC5_BH09BAC5_18260 [soil metagenome]